MVLFMCFLLLLLGGIGVVIWFVASRVLAHMRDDPEAAKLVSEHIIAPILTGKKPGEERKEETIL